MLVFLFVQEFGLLLTAAILSSTYDCITTLSVDNT